MAYDPMNPVPVEPAPQTQLVTTAAEPAVIGPLTRWLRTVVQVLGALIVTIPTAAAAFNVSGSTSAKYVSMMGAAVLVISGIINAINAKSSPTLLTGQRMRARRNV